MKRTKIEVTTDLVNKLWYSFKHRVPYARRYQEIISRRGGNVVIDHIGFRTLNTNTGEQPGGIAGISHIFRILGYKEIERYSFQHKKLKAVHLSSSVQWLPKIFISQLEVAFLPQWMQRFISDVVAGTPYLLSDNSITLLNKLEQNNLITHESAGRLVADLLLFFQRPWRYPDKEGIIKINDVSHYAAWTLLHGNAPSHFASLINAHGIPDMNGIIATCHTLKLAGIPLKTKIEGTKDNRIQQSSTVAIREDVKVRQDKSIISIPWTYAYLEFVQRHQTESDNPELFQGFVEEYESNLYKMTVTLEN